MKKETLYTSDLRRLKAEVVLDMLYPDADRHLARAKGSFYRNYSPDIIAIDPTTAEVELSRDGFLKSLPESYVSPEQSQESYEARQHRLSVLADAILPIDSQFFELYLQAQRQADSLMAAKTAYILRQYFDYDIEAEQNPHVRRMAYLLPFASVLRGKIGVVRKIFSILLEADVTTQSHPYSSDDNTRGYIPKTLFVAWIPGLNVDKYDEMMLTIRPLCRFAAEWFLPYDHIFDIEICDPNSPDNTILNYNTQIIQ